MANRCNRTILAALAALAVCCPGPAAAQHLRYNAASGWLESPIGGVGLYTPNSITAVGNITSPEVYAEDWFRASGGSRGLYNTSGGYFYPEGSNVWSITGNATPAQLIFRNGYGGATLGRIYADSSNFGLLNSAGSWMVYSPYGTDYSVISGGLKIATYGGIAASPLSYGTMALTLTKDGNYKGVKLGTYSGAPEAMCYGETCGIYYPDNGYWNYYWSRSAATAYVYNDTYVQNAINAAGKPVLTKVVIQLFCSNAWGCTHPGCPSGSVTGASSCSGQMCYLECCWGTN